MIDHLATFAAVALLDQLDRVNRERAAEFSPQGTS